MGERARPKFDGSLWPLANCSNGDLTQETGHFHSPNYPYNYVPNHKCIWIITIPEGKVNLKFQTFKVK